MRRLALFALMAAASALAPTAARADEASDLAKKVLDQGALFFEKKNLADMVNQYLEDARVFGVQKDQNTGEIQVETWVGKSEIESQYRKLFDESKPFYAKNEVNYARLIGDDILMVAGTFHLAVGDGQPLKLPFVQVREKRGDAWKIRSMRVFIIPQS
jgi:ketosteroid isomerase-like protein